MSLNERLISVGAAACTTDSVNPFGPNDEFSSNVALYQLDGNANDTTTNYNGTPTNITYGTGYIDQAAVFNGSSSKITLPSGFLDSATTLSFSVWVNPTSFVNFTGILDKYIGSTSGWTLDVPNATNRLPRINIYDGSFKTLLATTALTLGSWTHIVGTISTSEAKIYVNGSLEGTMSINPLITNTTPLVIGGDGVSTFAFDGSMDQIRIFDSAITAENVATLYAETAATASNTNPFGQGSGVALYTLDYDASDESGLYDGVSTNVEFGVEGQINYGARFNGSSSGIFLSSTGNSVTNYDQDFSVSMWVYMTNLPHATSQDHLWTGGGTRIIPMSITTSGYVLVDFFNVSSNTLTSTTALSLNGWTHVTLTRSKINGLSFYINGILSGTSSFTGNAGSLSQKDTIGQYWDGTRRSFDGSIDQIRFFQSALDSTQVTQLYNETACVYTCTTDTVDYPTTNVAYYKLDNSATDETGIYDGTETDISYTFGRFGQAAVFNGSSSYISSSNILDTSSAFSYSVWIKPQTIGLYDYLVGHQQAGSPYAGVGLIGTASNTFSIALAGGAPQAMTPSLTLNSWSHIVLTHDGSGNYTCYTNNNGSPITYSGATSNNASNPFRIGFSSVSGWSYFDGDIDQVRIFSSALTSTQVESLYNEYQCEDTSTFQTVLYTGNNSTQYVSNVGFEPDLLFLKARNQPYNWGVYDSVRGANKLLQSNTTIAEFNATDAMNSFDANGFTLGVGENSNNTSGGAVSSVGFCWKAGGDAVSNTDGSITSQVSANTDAGFSIVKYTGNLTAGATIGHGLSSAPELIIGKRLVSSGGNWTVFAEPVGATAALQLNTTIAAATATAYFNDTAPTDSVFTLGSNANLNNTEETIAYCFHSVVGYSKIGSYEGNGTTRNVDLGFNPSWIMIKNADTGSTAWNIVDTRRDTDTTLDLFLQANTSNAEATTTICSLITNGFSVTGTNTFNNSNGDTFIYLAFA